MFGGAFLMFLLFTSLPLLLADAVIANRLQEIHPEVVSANDLRIENISASSIVCGKRFCYANEICKKLTNDGDEQCVCKEGFSRSISEICEPIMDSVTDIANGVLLESAIPFRIEGPTTVRLPQNTVNLSIVFESSIDSLNYTYYWEVLDGGGFGSADTYTEPVLTLSGLKEGVITLRATVSNDNLRSYRDVSLKVLSEKKPNKPPVALIRPATPLYAVEGSRVVLDAEGSSDEDDSQLDFEWKLLNGPVVPLPAMNTAILRLDNLLVGNYSFGLTVKDKEGATDHRTVDVIVSAKRDDPPKAQISECGEQVSRSTIDVRLPTKTLLLCANISTDDYGITSYKWFRIDNLITQLAVDYSGSSTPFLKLTNLQANEKFGPYIFRLEVSDASGQTDSATISILVNKAVNHPPQPDAGGNQTIQLPIASTVLNGNVKDDGEIIKYQWTQISGPNEVMIVNGDKSKCTVSGFEEGVYQFRLNVTDDGGLTATDDTFVIVVRSKNEPPVARARNVTVYLPSNLAILNGSESFDDAGIVRYMWTAHDDVPACIMFLGSSSDQSIAMLGGLVPGVFHFDLTVTDHSNAQNSTTISLTVIIGEEQLNSIEMYLESDFNEVTYRLRNKLEGRIATTLAVQIPEAMKVDVRFSNFAQDASTGKLRVVFHTEFTNPTPKKGEEGSKSAIVVSATRVVAILRSEVDMIRDFHIASINTLYCMLDCSGHGRCSNYSKECQCDRYWMPNLFNYLLRGSKLDCSWSILYFGLFIVVTFIFVASCIVVRIRYRAEFGLTEWRPSKNRVISRRRRRRRFRRNDEDLHSNGHISGTSKLNEPSASYSLLMPSDSLSSENETELSTTNANRHVVVEQNGVELRGRPSVPFTE